MENKNEKTVIQNEQQSKKIEEIAQEVIQLLIDNNCTIKKAYNVLNETRYQIEENVKLSI